MREHSEGSDFRIEQLLLVFDRMTEAQFTAKVLIPLFYNLGYQRVDYNGGHDEGGKDLICWRTNEIGEMQLTTVQVKKYRLTSNATKTGAFAGVVNQLIQALSEKVGNSDGVSYYPSITYFITPFQLDNRALKSCFELYQNLRYVRVLDGVKVGSLLLEHNPHLASTLLGTEATIKWINKRQLSNDVLMSALQHNKSKQIKNIYTDIDFSIGRESSVIFFGESFKHAHKEGLEVSLGFVGWISLLKSNDECVRCFDVEILDKSEYNERADFEAQHAKHLTYISACAELRSTQNRLAKDVNDLILNFRSTIESTPNSNKVTRSIKKSCKKVELAVSEISTITCSRVELDKTAESLHRVLEDDGNRLVAADVIRREVVLEMNRLLDRGIDCRKKELDLPDKCDEPNRKIRVNAVKLAELLQTQRNSLSKTIAAFRTALPIAAELRVFIDYAQKILVNADLVLSNMDVRRALGISLDQRIVMDRKDYQLSCPIRLFFDSGADLIVLGEAGAGKSTSLQMYASTMLEDDTRIGTVFAPLSTTLNAWAAQGIEMDGDTPDLVDGLRFYFCAFGATVSEVELLDTLNRSGAVLLLDGIDEVVTKFAWIIDSIVALKARFPSLQIITSSRNLGSYTFKVPFFPITLLPFTVRQRTRFFEAWFESETSPDVSALVEHLRSNVGLSNATCNPLLATVLCTLQERGVKLPNREVLLYEERMRLLLGDYDKVKEINRVVTRRSALELLTRKLAFDLHDAGKREEDLEWFYQTAASYLAEHGEPIDPRKAIDELIDPSNILVPMNDRGQYGFGHLRFQEYLAARELNLNRTRKLEYVVGRPSWTGVFEQLIQLVDSPREFLQDSAMSMLSPESLNELLKSLPEEVRRMVAP